MRVIAPFGSSIEDIANHGCSLIASRFVAKLFEAKIAKAVRRVTEAKQRLSLLETELQLALLPRRGCRWELSDRQIERLKQVTELAEYDVADALEQHNAVLEAKDRCYWDVYVGDGPYR